MEKKRKARERKFKRGKKKEMLDKESELTRKSVSERRERNRETQRGAPFETCDPVVLVYNTRAFLASLFCFPALASSSVYRVGEARVFGHGFQLVLHRLLVLLGLRQRDLVRLGVSEPREKRVRLQRRHQRLRSEKKRITSMPFFLKSVGSRASAHTEESPFKFVERKTKSEKRKQASNEASPETSNARLLCPWRVC